MQADRRGVAMTEPRTVAPSPVLDHVEIDMLSGLAAAREIAPSMKGWLTPYFLGGRDASHHSRTLAFLVRQGFVEREVRGGWVRKSYKYRITPKGRAVLRG